MGMLRFHKGLRVLGTTQQNVLVLSGLDCFKDVEKALSCLL